MNENNYKLEVQKKSEVREYQFHDDHQMYLKHVNNIQIDFNTYNMKLIEYLWLKHRLNINESRMISIEITKKVDACILESWKLNIDHYEVYLELKTILQKHI